MSKFIKNRDLKQVKESDLQTRLISFLKEKNILYYKTHGGLAYMKIGDNQYVPKSFQQGFPDIIIFSEEVIFLELKTEKGTIRSSQKETIKKLNQLGYKTYIFKPHNFNKFVDALNGNLRVLDALNECDARLLEG